MANKGNTAILKKLHKEAKAICKAHPATKYKTALKKAGAKIRKSK